MTYKIRRDIKDRCQNCLYYTPKETDPNNGFCEELNQDVLYNDSCSYGCGKDGIKWLYY